MADAAVLSSGCHHEVSAHHLLVSLYAFSQLDMLKKAMQNGCTDCKRKTNKNGYGR